MASAGVSSSGASRCVACSRRSISRCVAPTSGTWFGSVARIRDGPARCDRTRRCGRGRDTRAVAAGARSGAEAAMLFVLRAPKRVTNDLSESIPHVVIWRRNHLAGIHHSRRRLRACRARRGAWPGWSGASRRPTCRPQSWRRTTSERSSAITRATRGRWRCRSDGARGCWATCTRGTRPSWSAPVPSETPPRRSPRDQGCSSRGFSRSARS